LTISYKNHIILRGEFTFWSDIYGGAEEYFIYNDIEFNTLEEVQEYIDKIIKEENFKKEVEKFIDE
jgi:hypothetical protein